MKKEKKVKKIVNIGDMFGQLEIINDFVGYYTMPCGHRRQKCRVRCSCGNEFEIETNYLKRDKLNNCRKCGVIKRRLYKAGDVIDNLKIIASIKRYEKNERREYLCECTCGNRVYKRSDQLTNNTTNSCGCQPNGSWKGCGDISGIMMSRIRTNARVRNIEVKVSVEYLSKLFTEQNGLCALTKTPIKISKLGGKRTTETTASLDRIDSSKPYEEGNVWWVHKDINIMKMDLPINRFLELCKMVAQNN